MQWFKNLRIRVKLLLSFIVVVAMTIVIAVVGIVSLVNIDTNYSHLIDFATGRLDALDGVRINLMDMRRIVTALDTNKEDSAALNTLESDAKDAYANISKEMTTYKGLVDRDDTFDAATKTARHTSADELIGYLSDYYNNVITPYLNDVRNQKSNLDPNTVTSYLSKGATVAGNADKLANDMRASALATRDTSNIDNSNAAATTEVTMITIAVVIVLLALILAFFVASVITKPIVELVDVAKNVAAGNLQVNIRADSKDEVGNLGKNISTVVESIKLLVLSMDHTSKEIEDGDIDARLDATKYQGSYREVAEGYNNVVQGIISDILVFIGCVSEFANGNFDANFPKLKGKKVVMNEARDTLHNNLASVNRDISTLINAAINGELATRANADNYKGDWAKIVTGLNNMLAAVDKPISETVAILTEISKGNLNNKMTTDYKGSYNTIKNSLNSMCETISSYITEISNVLGEMSDNNLNLEIKREYLGDFNAIKESLNSIIDSFNQVIGSIIASTDQVASGAKVIADSSMLLAEGATTQASSVEELNASIDTISEKTNRSATDAQSANKLSVSSKDNAIKGNTEMHRMLESMQGIKSASDNISKINKVIEDIALQTNLLALNAAVEAARAGEHGKGFAVVAEQVRSLAGRSQDAAKEANELIITSNNKVDEGTQIAQLTAESLEKIVDDFNQVSGIISGIATSAEDQADSIKQISIGIAQIAQVVQNNSSTSEEAAATSQELSSQSDTLKSMVSVFRLKRMR